MDTVGGLPAHILLVHVVVIILPLTAAAAVLGSIWPGAQRKFTFLTPLGALVGMIAVPLTVQAGQALAKSLGGVSPALARHITYGGRVLPFAIALFVVTLGQWAYLRFAPPRRALTIAIAIVVILVAVATTGQVVLTGDAGSRAVWQGVLQ